MKHRNSQRLVAEGVCEVDVVDAARVAEARGELPPEAGLRKARDAFKVLAHVSRLRILSALDGRELCVCDVSRVLGLSMSGTSQHLRELRNLGAVDYRAAGKLVYYTLAERFWLELTETVLERMSPRRSDGVHS
jgi:ArsR family transcriptional regulator, lead/cadmium/zinc/bismuth-responsive transcriptional repressor